MSGAVEVKDFTKIYNGITAVDSLDLEVKRGEVFGFLGPNGAGKTTTIKAMMGLLEPTDGEIIIGDELVNSSTGISSTNVGYLPENIDLWDNLKGIETLKFVCELKGRDEGEAFELLSLVGLEEAGDRKVKEYSKGMLRRLAIAQSLIGDPDLLILDEPSSGLDPSGTAMVKDIIRDHVSDGGTVFLSSHILPMVESVADRVGILFKGRLRALDTLEDLKEDLQIPTKIQFVLSDDHKLIEEDLKENKTVKSFRGDHNLLTVTCNRQDKKAVLDLIEDLGAEIEDFSVREGSLEDVYLSFSNEGDER